jgi:tRNA pseudouridine55 synthase
MINGILIIDKPEGMTSAKTVSKIKGALKSNKAGHTGTLDPFATGILIVCLNNATKIAQYLSDLDKTYIGTMVLGITTDTQDLKGRIQKIIPVDQKKLNPREINKVFSKFQGDIWQIPPMFSALKYKGLRLYSLARKGIKIKLVPRKITIYQLNLIHTRYDRYPSITFQVRCSKGTYIRTLCHDIGKALGFGAYMSHLRRIEIGNYVISKSIPLGQFLKLPYREQQYKHILPLDLALNHLNKIILTGEVGIEDRIKNGGQFSEKEIGEKIISSNAALKDIFTIYSSKGYLIAIAKRLGESLKEANRYKVEKLLT